MPWKIYANSKLCCALVNNKKDLVRRLNTIQAFTKEEFDEIAGEVKASVEKLVRL